MPIRRKRQQKPQKDLESWGSAQVDSLSGEVYRNSTHFSPFFSVHLPVTNSNVDHSFCHFPMDDTDRKGKYCTIIRLLSHFVTLFYSLTEDTVEKSVDLGPSEGEAVEA